MNFTEFSKYYIAKIDEINTFFINTLDLAEPLKNSLMYSYTAGGKRIRPLLMLSMLEAFQEDINKGLKTAACLELIHTSSLIHDDLPAMDNDDYRRGKLTNHKVFGEATAILAGDSLLVDSIRLITDDDLLDNEIKVQLISYLSNCVGAKGMIGGQQLDIE
ncbi:MAG TPA: polyprenyl synthetase family protein, partial [Haloplasmataceae bacterium]